MATMVGHTGLKLRMLVVGTILFGFFLLIASFVWAAWGDAGLIVFIVFGGLLYPLFLYKFGRWSAIRSVGAEDMPTEPTARYRFDEIHRTTERLCDEMGLDKPRLMVAEFGAPNAFAVGRKKAGVVVISTELIDLLDYDELEGVIAHELAHIKNRDTVVMVMGQAIAAMVGWVVYIAIAFRGQRDIGTIIVAMIASTLAQLLVSVFLMAISRYREYVADDDAAQYTRNPDAMARALEKISAGASGKEMRGEDNVSALCIFGEGGLAGLLSTHPPTEKRIERLRTM